MCIRDSSWAVRLRSAALLALLAFAPLPTAAGLWVGPHRGHLGWVGLRSRLALSMSSGADSRDSKRASSFPYPTLGRGQ
eukprot:15860-Alexandrium_andersonii.AAC.1